MLTVDWANKVVYSDESILDLPAHHLELRSLEASEQGMLHDDICQWQSLTLRGGATLPQIDYINDYELQFIGPGPFVISGNLNCTIRNTGVQIERETSASFITTSVGGSGGGSSLTQQQVRDAVWNAPTASHVNEGSFGKFIQSLLTVGKFIGLK